MRSPLTDSKTCFPRLMEKVTRAGKPRARMIDVQYSQKANQDRDREWRQQLAGRTVEGAAIKGDGAVWQGLAIRVGWVDGIGSLV